MKLVVGGRFLLALAIVAGLLNMDSAHARTGMLDSVFATHIAAIQNRNLETLERTITHDDRLTLILPGGEATYSKAEYLEFHRTFFLEPEWSIEFLEVARIVGSDFAVITTRSRFTYRVNNEPRVSQSWVTFTFAKQGNEWRLVADQNTRLPLAAAKEN